MIGVDVNDVALQRCAQKTKFTHEEANGQVFLKKGDARHLDFIPPESIGLICTHPPYANAIQYSDDISDDLPHLDVPAFLVEMVPVAKECYRGLKPEHFCTILMGDMRKNGFVVPLWVEVMSIFERAGFQTKEIIIKEHHNCKSTAYWRIRSEKQNFLLLAHEYLFTFKKQ